MRDQLRKGRRPVRNLASLLGASGSASIGEATDPPVFLRNGSLTLTELPILNTATSLSLVATAARG
jgi:hypothetical protein